MPAKPKPELDERVALPLDPETALQALLAVEPDQGELDDEDAKSETD